MEVPAAAVAPPKPSFYALPEEVDDSRIRFLHRPPDKSTSSLSKGGVVINSFKVFLEPLPTPGLAVPAKGQKKGKGPKNMTKLPSLALRTSHPLKTKVGIRASLPQNCTDKKLREFVDNPDNVNMMAIGLEPVREGVSFQILYYLDPTNPEDQKLKALSQATHQAFCDYIDKENPVAYNEKTFFENIKSIVRVSDKTESEYIVAELSVKRSVDGKDYFPTPFMLNEEPLLWGSLMNMKFESNIEFKVSHIIMNGNDKAVFKIYLSQCDLIVAPQTALSEEAQVRAQRFDQMKQAVLKAKATAVAVAIESGDEEGFEVDEPSPPSPPVPPPPPPPKKKAAPRPKKVAVESEEPKKKAKKVVAIVQEDEDPEDDGIPDQDDPEDPVPTGIITVVGKKKA